MYTVREWKTFDNTYEVLSSQLSYIERQLPWGMSSVHYHPHTSLLAHPHNLLHRNHDSTGTGDVVHESICDVWMLVQVVPTGIYKSLDDDLPNLRSTLSRHP